jgi:hypothetical protein
MILRRPKAGCHAGLALLLVAMLSGCVVFTGSGDETGVQRELSRARQMWSANRSTDYEYVLRRDCFCPLGGIPVRVTVRSSAVVSAIDETTGTEISDELRPGYPTVEGLFDTLQNAIDLHADRIVATYDPQLGVPSSFSIDYLTDAIDEELGYRVSAFAALR